MKGLKTWALLGGFAIATSCSMAFAADPQYVEGQTAGSDRGIALDELFAAFKKNVLDTKPAATKTADRGQKVAVKTPTIAPTSHLTPAKKSPKAHTVTAKKATPSSTATAAEPQTEPTEPNNSTDSGVLLAASAAASASQIVSAKLDKPGLLPKYKSGDRMVVKLNAKQDCNVLVFDYDSKGTLTQLYPNEFEPNGTLRAGTDIEIGGEQSKYTLDINGKGIERIFVYAYPTSDAPITVAMNPIPHTPFRSVEITPDQYRKLVQQSRSYSNNTIALASASSDRGVRVTAKSGGPTVANASATTSTPANKVELVFQIDK